MLNIAWGAPAVAESSLVGQVETMDVERGESELETGTIFASTAEVGGRSVWIHTLSGEYGLTNRASLGFELLGSASSGEGLTAESVMLQAKFIALDPRMLPFGLGAQISFGPSLAGEPAQAELEVLLETVVGAALFSADLAFESEIVSPVDIAVQYAVRSDWFASWGGLGIEAGGDLNFSDHATRHWIGPLVAIQLRRELAIEFGYFHGLNEATPANQFRMQLELTG